MLIKTYKMIKQQNRISIHQGSKEQAMILKALLESFSIMVFEDSSLMSVFNPWGVLVGDVNSVKLRVKEEDYNEAKKIIDDLILVFTLYLNERLAQIKRHQNNSISLWILNH